MAVKITGKGPDERVEQILRDPKTYFAQARQRARAALKAEREQDGARLRRRPA